MPSSRRRHFTGVKLLSTGIQLVDKRCTIGRVNASRAHVRRTQSQIRFEVTASRSVCAPAQQLIQQTPARTGEWISVMAK